VSQTPPHTSPELETVTRLGFEELNVKVALTAVLDEFCALAVSCATSPAFSERLVGITVTLVTAFLFDELPPPQPVSMVASKKMIPGMMAKRLMRPPRLGYYPCGLNERS